MRSKCKARKFTLTQTMNISNAWEMTEANESLIFFKLNFLLTTDNNFAIAQGVQKSTLTNCQPLAESLFLTLKVEILDSSYHWDFYTVRNKVKE